ncbi:MAG: hypothetical protein A4E62_02906 [Syntrophorhabdus sp. PtaU1.Bin002]|nr:MAG: hypothetical protein A4E62_02906 [Syntrophorhabdus sp. PtaU1.Bin002]
MHADIDDSYQRLKNHAASVAWALMLSCLLCIYGWAIGYAILHTPQPQDEPTLEEVKENSKFEYRMAQHDLLAAQHVAEKEMWRAGK